MRTTTTQTQQTGQYGGSRGNETIGYFPRSWLPPPALPLAEPRDVPTIPISPTIITTITTTTTTAILHRRRTARPRLSPRQPSRPERKGTPQAVMQTFDLNQSDRPVEPTAVRGSCPSFALPLFGHHTVYPAALLRTTPPMGDFQQQWMLPSDRGLLISALQSSPTRPLEAHR
jgi:hypothetical protein